MSTTWNPRTIPTTTWGGRTIPSTSWWSDREFYALLQESGYFLLQENGYKIRQQQFWPPDTNWTPRISI